MAALPAHHPWRQLASKQRLGKRFRYHCMLILPLHTQFDRFHLVKVCCHPLHSFADDFWQNQEDFQEDFLILLVKATKAGLLWHLLHLVPQRCLTTSVRKSRRCDWEVAYHGEDQSRMHNMFEETQHILFQGATVSARIAGMATRTHCQEEPKCTAHQNACQLNNIGRLNTPMHYGGSGADRRNAAQRSPCVTKGHQAQFRAFARLWRSILLVLGLRKRKSSYLQVVDGLALLWQKAFYEAAQELMTVLLQPPLLWHNQALVNGDIIAKYLLPPCVSVCSISMEVVLVAPTVISVQ